MYCVILITRPVIGWFRLIKVPFKGVLARSCADVLCLTGKIELLNMPHNYEFFLSAKRAEIFGYVLSRPASNK
jgi:hypothetical protein